ncbi:MAG: family 16 glycoside hydrolase [Verrucomicrobiota bacterium]|jgi:hypothetical protein
MNRAAPTVQLLLAALLLGAVRVAPAAQIQFDLGRFPGGGLPPGFASLVSGVGKPGDWKIMDEIIPSVRPVPLPGALSPTAKHSVLAQSSQDATEGHFPILLYTNETLLNFTLTTRLKILSGSVAPEAGVVFRAQDQSNFYVLRASTRGDQNIAGSLLWYRVVDGVRHETQGKGVLVPIPPDTWQELRLECLGSGFRAFWNGKQMIPPVLAGAPTNDAQLPRLNDSTFATGKFGFWTAADTVAYFADTRIDYTPRVPLIQTAVAEVMKKNSRLLGLKVFEFRDSPAPVLVADGKEQGLGAPGGKTEEDVIRNGAIMYLKLPDSVELTLPLRDRNGDIIAALRTTLPAFRGETTETAVARATAVKKAVEEQLNTLQDINE